jgi:hypothetical protein
MKGSRAVTTLPLFLGKYLTRNMLLGYEEQRSGTESSHLYKDVQKYLFRYLNKVLFCVRTK